ADYTAFKNGKRNISLYTLKKESLVHASRLLLNPSSDPASQHDYIFTHWYPVWIENNASFTTPVSRFRVGQSFFETLAAYRMDNGIDQFPSVKSKLGPEFEKIAKSPLFNQTFGVNFPGTFKEFVSYANLHFNPAIMFIHGYLTWPDESHPPYLPPDPQWGTTQDFQYMISEMQKQGKVVVPFTIPSLWIKSPWLNEAPSAQDIAAINITGNPFPEQPWDNLGALYVCPYSDFVQQKLDQIYSDIFNVLGCDMVYEDIGLISHRWDFNENSPSPMHSAQGWLEHFRKYSDKIVVTEGICDVVAEYVLGFLAISWRGDQNFPDAGEKDWDYETGTGTMRTYPIGPVLLHDKIIPFSAWGFDTNSKDILTYCLLFGCSLKSNFLDHEPRVLSSPWLDEVRDFQRHVVARLVGKQMTDYQEISSAVAQSTYEDMTVIKNHHPKNAYDVGTYTISPQGALVKSSSGDLTAGIFYEYNNRQLSQGDHYIIEVRNDNEIIIYYPQGNNTELAVELLPGWSANDPIRVTAYSESDLIIESRFASVEDNFVTFNCRSSIMGIEIGYYRIILADNLLQPTWTTFFEDGMETLIIGNRDYYEIGIDRGGYAVGTGGISYILDRITNTRLTTELGHDDKLWQARTFYSSEGFTWVGSDGHFLESYRWSDTTNTLTLTYSAFSDTEWNQKVDVTVSITVSEESYFDMQMTFRNGCDFPFSEISFPCQIEFSRKDINKILIPYGFPGITLENNLFKNVVPFLDIRYPRDLHADFMAVNIGNSNLAFYSLSDSYPVHATAIRWSGTENPELAN
ncbi:hypothetical protein BVY01_00005, partial [bacterium I07]